MAASRLIIVMGALILVPGAGFAAPSFLDTMTATVSGTSFEELKLSAKHYIGSGDAKKDYVTAFYWAEKAAYRGMADAQYLLGSFYRDGTGVTANIDMAKRWLLMASKQGHEEAQIQLSKLLDGEPYDQT